MAAGRRTGDLQGLQGESAMDVGRWLRDLGLDRYEKTFADNAIDADVLTDLEEGDLEKIGVLLGHRKKLLRAIAGLRPSSKAEDGREPERSGAERRQLTVAFCDLVGWTGISAGLDPEDLRDLLTAYHVCVARVVEHHAGFVAQFLGDGAIVYFGYPSAQEDDPERAVRCSLELVRAIAAIETDGTVTLSARVGVTTGMVVAGDLVGAPGVQIRNIVGDAPNLASRLQTLAEPGTVVIADSTHRLLGNLFDCRDLGEIIVKNLPNPVRAWLVRTPNEAQSRFEALHSIAMAPLIGRRDELNVILEAWTRAKAKRGQVLLISAEPGIGKSRLAVAALEQMDADVHHRLHYYCSPRFVDSALRPAIAQLERAARFEADDAPVARFDKLHKLLARTGASPEDVALLADLLSLPRDELELDLAYTSQQKKVKTMEALLHQLEALAEERPLVMVFEDVHWADPSSLDVLDRVIASIRENRVLVLITFRPEFKPPWTGQPHVIALPLHRLDATEGAALIERLVGSIDFPLSATMEIVDRADGVPLFIEELTRAVLESRHGTLGDEALLTAMPSARSQVPATLQASLLGRLDRLGAAKEIAQIGSAIGREFSFEMLLAVARRDDSWLRAGLHQLVKAGIIFRRGGGEASYLFKHALVQDAAYGTMLRPARQALHARIAEELRARSEANDDVPPELIALHLTEAALPEQAIAYWSTAGEQSMGRMALKEATAHLNNGLGQIGRLPSSPAVRFQRLRMEVMLAGILMLTKGIASPTAKQAFGTARGTIETIEAAGDALTDQSLEMSIAFGLWLGHYMATDTDQMRDEAERVLLIAGRQQSDIQMIVGKRVMGTTLLVRGEFEAGLRCLDEAIALYRPDQHRILAARFSQDMGMAARVYRCHALWHLGYPDTALRSADDVRAAARVGNHIATLMYVLILVATLKCFAGRSAAAIVDIDELDHLNGLHGGLPFYTAICELLRGWTFAIDGRHAAATRVIASGLTAYRATGATLFLPCYQRVLAHSLLKLGSVDESRAMLRDAIEAAEVANEGWIQAELQRMAGELELAGPAPDAAKAETHFRRSAAMAAGQGAKMFELATATSLARLLASQGRREDACDLLAPRYAFFSEGHGLETISAAKATLAALSAG